jgi:hypothetical protein
MHRKTILSGLPAFALLACFVSAQSGLTLEKKVTNTGMMARGGASGTKTLYLADDFIREVSSDGTERIIFVAERKMVNIDHNKKEYSEITFAELNAMLEDASSKMAQNQQAMEAMKKMMGGGSGQITLEEEGPGEEIAGYDTRKYRLLMNPITVRIWAAPDLEVPKVYYDMLKLSFPPNPMFDMAAMFDNFKKIEGLGLKTETSMKMMGMEGKSVEEVVDVKKGSIPAAAIPENYRKKEVSFEGR